MDLPQDARSLFLVRLSQLVSGERGEVNIRSLLSALHTG